MARKGRVVVRLREAEVGKFLKSPEVQKMLKKLANEVAQATEAKYRAAGKDYKFEVFTAPTSQRTRVIIGSNDGDHARYSEASRGYLLDEINKKRTL